MKCWVRFLVCLICIIGGLKVNAGYAQSRDFITGNFRKFEIPFEYFNNFIIVNVYFNDVFPLKFIFDTGAEHTVLTKREITDLFQVDYTRKFTLYGADMQTALYAYLAPGITLRVSNLKAINRSILVLDEDYLNFEEFTGVKVHGILGADFFQRFMVEINYRKRKIILHDPKHFKPPKKGFTEVPIEITRNKPYLNSEVVLNKEVDADVKLLIDTGASLAMMLYTTTHPDLELPSKVLKTNIGMGLGGYIEGFIGRVDLLNINEFSMDNVVTNYQEVILTVDSTYLNDRNGILGNKILERFTVIFDYINNTIYLNPNKKFNKKFKFDKSGLIIAAGGENLNKYSVIRVLEESPAREAGLKKGDTIIGFNGLPVTFYTLDGILNRLKKRTGKTIRIKVEREGEKLKFKFKLRDLI